MRHSEKSHSDYKLAIEATSHCLMGCGLGDVGGFFLGTLFGFTYLTSVLTGILLGLLFGYLLGIIPLLRAKILFPHATKIVLTTETLSIVVMETAETLIELFFPGMKRAGILHFTYWLGLGTALLFGFLAAYPANLFLVRRGIRHHH